MKTVGRRIRRRPTVTLARPSNPYGEVWHWKQRVGGSSGTLIIYRQFGYASWIYDDGSAPITTPIAFAEGVIADHVERAVMGQRSSYSQFERVDVDN